MGFSLQYLAHLAVFLALAGIAAYQAYNIRLYAIKVYGLVIHEFDPWFNFRATKYLADNGIYEFFHWFDHTSWYPLGRPVGTTIYPGMQLTSVAIWKVLGFLGGDWAMSLNDVCCYVPAWFGVLATSFLGLLTAECSGSLASGGAAALIMAIVPAHIMRSVGGGYDNESIALTAMCSTFYFWCRALRADASAKDGARTKDSVKYGVLAGIAYINMVAAWGGFVFVLNLIGAHAAILVLLGRFSSKLHTAYSLFFVIGTLGAVQVPVVGWNPFKSFEQLAPFGVFLGFQLLEYCERQRRQKKLSWIQLMRLRVQVFTPFMVVLSLLVLQLLSMGYFGPLTARVRGLFVKHTRTGNPLVDSVAEHQPANEQAYYQYLHHIYYLAPVGFVISFLRINDSNIFLISYAVVAYYFSSKMARLVILLGPVASALGGVAIGFAVDNLLLHALPRLLFPGRYKDSGAQDKGDEGSAPASGKQSPRENKKDSKKKEHARVAEVERSKSALQSLKHNLTVKIPSKFNVVYNSKISLLARLVLFLVATQKMYPKYEEFKAYCHQMAEGMSQPSIMFKAKLRSGEEIMVDDYREAYWWLRDNTPEDARVLSWWDYGYQISGIGERTTLADGNTWNHEHIATLGKILTANVKNSHRMARHLADYVLVWAGGGGDDLAKSPHMARIANSVFPDVCPGDPTCSQFGFYRGGMPTPMMEESLLYALTQYGIKPGVELDSSRYKHVYTSKYGKCRIFKIVNISTKSKKWLADPANKLCDAPGSWYCPGQYPAALDKLIASRKNFAQLEDFNKKKDSDAAKYNEEYMARMAGQKPKSTSKEKSKDSKADAPATLKFIGCFGSESHLGSDKEYFGDTAGANVQEAVAYSLSKKKKYIALARAGDDGHAFAFSKAPAASKALDGGMEACGLACADQDAFKCGCADAACAKRRWAVYQVTKSKKSKKKKKKKKIKKEEL